MAHSDSLPDVQRSTLVLDASLADLPAIRDFVVCTARTMGLDEETIFHLKLAADEACSNVIRHAYGGQGGKLELTMEYTGCAVKLTLRDWGVSFDPHSVAPPDLESPLDERPLGGLGLFLIRQLVDQVEFRFDCQMGNTLIMIKSLGGNSNGANHHDI